MIYEDLEAFKQDLINQEKKEKTIKQYSNYIMDLIEWAKIKNKEDITKEMLIDYKEYLKYKHSTKEAYRTIAKKYNSIGAFRENKKPSEKIDTNINSINIKILIINKFITYLQLPKELKLKQEKQQKQTTLENVLTAKEYEHLREYAKSHNQMQLYYLMRNVRGYTA